MLPPVCLIRPRRPRQEGGVVKTFGQCPHCKASMDDPVNKGHGVVADALEKLMRAIEKEPVTG